MFVKTVRYEYDNLNELAEYECDKHYYCTSCPLHALTDYKCGIYHTGCSFNFEPYKEEMLRIFEVTEE